VLLEAARMLSGSTLRSQETQQQQQQKQQQQEQKEQEEKQDVRKSLSKRQQLKLAVRDYGATVMVFHITISLASLGICYAAISR
jgi:ribosomal protein L9